MLPRNSHWCRVTFKGGIMPVAKIRAWPDPYFLKKKKEIPIGKLCCGRDSSPEEVASEEG